MDKKLTLKDVRIVLADSADYVFGHTLKPIDEISDEELLSLRLKEDLNLDSLDMIVVTMSLERDCHVVITDNVIETLRNSDNTVQALLDECNRCILAR